ncbi:YlzJ-like family protein [Bacillus sp. FJAT-47783]|uniref:YlzJ-like family protein n=1 Tax=Bacillus sp. FJAT-47783 TaxID=2922712 RepID=UPI001FAD8E11|nr:YlzJ-like family protein [Bacillus sp. FJAT-47783]
MILYTTMPQELVFQPEQSDFLKQKVVRVNGVSVLVQEKEHMKYEVLRVLSSNPNHFLLESLAPGTAFGLDELLTFQ